MTDSKIRVLLTKPTHDCHDRGVRYLARRLRDEGFEVVFANFLLPEEVVRMALQEDADVIGVSSSAGGHMEVLRDLLDGLAAEDARDVLVIAGGVIPDEDAATLRGWGVASVFGPGSTADSVAETIRARVRSL